MSTRTSKHAAFTLIEMLASTVLAAMMFVALTSLLRGISNQERAVDRKIDAYPDAEILTDMLRRDLTNTQYVQSEATGVRLVGTIASDWRTRRSTGRLAEVTYRVATIDEKPWLVRREVHLDETSTQRSREELVWSGVSAIDVLADSREFDGNAQRGMPAYALGMRRASSQLVVIVRQADGTPLLNVSVCHHWEEF